MPGQCANSCTMTKPVSFFFAATFEKWDNSAEFRLPEEQFPPVEEGLRGQFQPLVEGAKKKSPREKS